MYIPTLLALVMFLPQQAMEAQLQQQQRTLQRQQQQLQQLERRVERSVGLLEEVRQEHRDQQPQPSCAARISWVAGSERRDVPPGDTVSVLLNLFSTVSRPRETCLPAEVRVTVSFLDGDDNLVCNGAVPNVAVQDSLTQSINLELWPWNFREFVWWRNEPPQTNSGPRAFFCLTPDGQAQVTPGQLERVVSVRIWTTVFPPGGGLSSAELRLDLQR